MSDCSFKATHRQGQFSAFRLSTGPPDCFAERTKRDRLLFPYRGKKRRRIGVHRDHGAHAGARIARELAEENVRNQQARYNAGLVTPKDLLDCHDKLTQARATPEAAPRWTRF